RFHNAFLKPAADEVGDFLAGLEIVHIIGVDLFPIPLRSREVAVGRQGRLATVVTASLNATPLGRLDNDLRTVHVTGNDVHALVDQARGSFRLLNRHGPVAGEDHVAGDRRIDAACSQGEGIDVSAYLRD